MFYGYYGGDEEHRYEDTVWGIIESVNSHTLLVELLAKAAKEEGGTLVDFYILFHTGMRISEFCGLTLSDLDMEKRIINIDHQLQRTSEMEYLVSSTKTNAGTRKIPMTDGVFRCFQAIIEDRETQMFEKMVDGHTGFLFLDAQGMPEVAMHWEYRFNHAVKRHYEI